MVRELIGTWRLINCLRNILLRLSWSLGLRLRYSCWLLRLLILSLRLLRLLLVRLLLGRVVIWILRHLLLLLPPRGMNIHSLLNLRIRMDLHVPLNFWNDLILLIHLFILLLLGLYESPNLTNDLVWFWKLLLSVLHRRLLGLLVLLLLLLLLLPLRWHLRHLHLLVLIVSILHLILILRSAIRLLDFLILWWSIHYLWNVLTHIIDRVIHVSSLITWISLVAAWWVILHFR